MTDAPDPVRLKRLRFRAWRRGFREADLILGGFVDARGETLSAPEIDAFEALLDENDQEVFAWIAGQKTPPKAHATPLMQRLRAFRVDLFDSPNV